MNEYADMTTHVNFIWRSRNGTETPIYEMPTSHLYNCLKMVWNHSVRTDCIIHPFKHKYEFDTEIYTRSYVIEAIESMIKELQFRGDKLGWQSSGTHLMANTLYKFGRTGILK